MTKHWRTALLTPALALTLALAACGGSSNSDEDTITKLVKDVNETPATYCDNASKSVLDAIGGKDGCLEAVKGEKGGDTSTKIEKITIDGDKATASFTDATGKQEVKFAKEDGDWKILADTNS